MERTKEFLRSISKTGWIIVSFVGAVIILLIVGVLIAKKGVDLWPFNNGIQIEEYANNNDGNEELLAQVDRAIQSANDSVLSIEDVLNGKYDNSIEAATIFENNTQEVQVAVVFDNSKYAIEGLNQTSCGKLAFVTTRVPNNPGVINETLKAIFADKVYTDFEPGNIIPAYHPDLVFDNAVIEDGVAKIYLRGEFGSSEKDNCGEALAISEIEGTVKQFETVKDVEIYQNLKKIN